MYWAKIYDLLPTDAKCVMIIFHILGHGKYNGKLEVKDGRATTPAGECLVGMGPICELYSVNSLRAQLLSSFNADKITLTLDCCRNDPRGTVELQ